MPNLAKPSAGSLNAFLMIQLPTVNGACVHCLMEAKLQNRHWQTGKQDDYDDDSALLTTDLLD